MNSTRAKGPVVSRKQNNRPRYDNTESNKEPVQVYCRLRPVVHPGDVSCMRVVSDTTIIITLPETAINYRNASKVIQTSFSRVFTSDAPQSEVFNVVALPLVENLINGKNSLLFTYGVTGSGKTYTMTGTHNDPGIMLRSLNVLFNSIANFQAKKFVFNPDRLNGFDVQSEAEALLDRQNELHAGLTTHYNGRLIRTPSRKLDSDSDSNPIYIQQTDDICTLPIDEDNVYAVFVTYIEIYNNSVYDLLEEGDCRNKTLQSKIIREDGQRNMYVHAVTEVEVKSSEEALEMFRRGQCKRRVAYTALNAESSRSHSVFTIRLVQAPLDCNGEQAVQDKRAICISQLSLVDLAGSERTNRSKNTGQRLREAGNINNSLMTLRTCLEILRENQTQGTIKMVPYRDSKLTHLFKNYFEGEGQVRMIVCVNPRAEDYDETIQVMKFAEITQEVQVARPMATKLDLGYTPGRRQANKMFREAQSRLEKAGYGDAADLDVDIGLVYSLGGQFPEFEVTNPHNDQVITALMRFLELRIQKRNQLRADLQQKQNDFRNMLVKMERENVSLKIENVSLKAANDQQKKKISALEGHVCKTEGQIDTLLYKLNTANDAIRSLQQELMEKDLAVNQHILSKQKVKQKYNSKFKAEAERMNKDLEAKLRQQQEHLRNQMKNKEDKLKLVKQILENETESDLATVNGVEPTSVTTAGTTEAAAVSTTSMGTDMLGPKTESATVSTPVTAAKTEDSANVTLCQTERIPVVNPRYRRSQSVDRWLDHRPGALVPVGTIFQPLMHRKISVTHLTDPKSITERASRYCLVDQEQDTDGELETKLYKGDILPTSGGGAQVVFNDMEFLKQQSPLASRKRSGAVSPRSEHISLPPDHQSNGSEANSKRPRV